MAGWHRRLDGRDFEHLQKTSVLFLIIYTFHHCHSQSEENLATEGSDTRMALVRCLRPYLCSAAYPRLEMTHRRVGIPAAGNNYSTYGSAARTCAGFLSAAPKCHLKIHTKSAWKSIWKWSCPLFYWWGNCDPEEPKNGPRSNKSGQDFENQN